MEKIILSPYTHLFEEKNGCYVFNAESLFFSRIDESTYTALIDHSFEDLDKDVIDTLMQKQIIIYERDRYNAYNHALTGYLTSAYSSDTMSLIIAPTTGCNFECPYCFEPKKNPKTITGEVEDKLIEYINKQEHIKNISLTWYGGEPLLCMDAIRRIYDRIIEETDKTIIYQDIISNSYLINDAAIEMMKHCKMNRIQVSIDGAESNHDKTRFLKGTHAPTYKIIERNIENLAKAMPDLQISIRVNITKENWEDFVTIYNKYCDNDEEWHKNIFPYPGIIRMDTKDGCRLSHQCYRISDLVDLYLLLGKKGVNVSLFPKLRAKGCMMQRQNSFIVGPEGELYKCWNDVSNPEKTIGSIMDNKRHHYDILMKYMQESGPFGEECRECSVFPICDGGCGYVRYRNKFENGSFERCSSYKDIEKLKKALLYSISSDKDKKKKRLNF